MKHVILLSVGQEPAGALCEALREAGVDASLVRTPDATTETTQASDAGERAPSSPPLAVLYEIAAGTDTAELHAAVNHAVAVWPGAPLVACRRNSVARSEQSGANNAHALDVPALMRLGFSAVADDPAQLPALLRELQERGTSSDLRLPENILESAPASALLPEKLNVQRLRAAFEAVATLHFATDQKSAASTALAGLAALVRADRWTIYLAGDVRTDPQEISFELLAVRGLTASERVSEVHDWRRAFLNGELALAGSESRAARLAVSSAEIVRQREGARRVLAVPLVCGERVLGVLEAVREGTPSRSFNASEAALLSALSVPLTAALANSARIAEAERLSQTDDLTKLHNARFLRQYLIAEIKRARRYSSYVTALFLDLDDFKQINDRYGHLVGSHVLMEMAAVILKCVRDTDVVSRYGGDEFVVILPETGLEQASSVAERVRDRIAGHVFTGGRNLRLRLTASFGVASFPQHAQSPQQLIACADNAMYQAKAARKNCICFASEAPAT